MNEEIGLSHEEAVWYNKLHTGEAGITDPVYLKTTYTDKGKEPLISGVFQREFLKSWLFHAHKENSSQFVQWLMLEKEEVACGEV